MAQLSEKAIREFAEIYEDEYKIKLTNEETKFLALEVMALFAVIYKPITEESNEKIYKPKSEISDSDKSL